jgi:hypothetical protein
MKIVVVANCQGESLASCLAAMNPALIVSFCMITDIQNGKQNITDLLNLNDFIFSQKNIINSVPDELKHKVILFPSIAFSAFQPDITYLRSKKSDGSYEVVESLMVSYHSAIAVFGYLNNVSVKDILSFYNPHVYSKLGYFDCWNNSRKLLMQEGIDTKIPLNQMFASWEKKGCFMYSFNHPNIMVMSDIAKALMQKANINIINHNGAQYLDDSLKAMPVWPVYPEIAARYEMSGDYAFKRHNPHGVVDLQNFIENSYANYARYERTSLEPLNFSMEEFNIKLGFTSNTQNDDNSTQLVQKSSNPYSTIPSIQFWKKSVASIPYENVDPILNPLFKVDRTQKIATAGSCFAQHIARTLKKNGFNYYVPEAAPIDMDADLAKANNFGTFSARFGNVYTVRQLVQLVDRAFGQFVPKDQYWLRNDGRFIDPFRPQIEPEGFKTLADAEESRSQHFLAVREMFEVMDVFVFTLGLTEGWRSRYDGAVFPLAPGVAGGQMDDSRYEFVNFTAEQVTADLEAFIARLSSINPKCKVILTVSPVPLIATFESSHALVATTYSKSVLRVAAQNVNRLHEHVEYFPSFEIITGSFNKGKYFEDDLRSVTDDGVAHVMRLFLKHYMLTNLDDKIDNGINVIDSHLTKKIENDIFVKNKSLFDLVCDEEAIAKF